MERGISNDCFDALRMLSIFGSDLGEVIGFSMVIRLNGELEAVVEREVSAGRFHSVDECVAHAVELLLLHSELAEERRLLEQSLAEAANGELMTEEDVRKELSELQDSFLFPATSAV